MSYSDKKPVSVPVAPSDPVPNRLIREKSPYLLQHARNPVDWYPWGDEAFKKAAAEDKPVFLSIGYSSCHWCHRMEEDCFKDEEAAKVLNQDFVSIKVDREERPDVDHFYMEACIAMTGHGGWPLTCFVMPDRHPFFAGTYFPKKANRYGQIGFIDLLTRIIQLWKTDRTALKNTSREFIDRIREETRVIREGKILYGEDPDEETARLAVQQMKDSFDSEYGGFGRAPKFPSVHSLMFLLGRDRLKSERTVAEMALKTLSGMADGGIHDHVGGGFCRYSTDRKWLVPHFEKMMYDNAMLLSAYAKASRVSDSQGQSARFRRVAEGILAYCVREMRHPEGGFYTAQDADSGGVEGRYYLWTPEEVRNVLGPDAPGFCQLYDIKKGGNFDGASIPNRIGKSFSDTEETFASGCLERLRLRREQRVPPSKDDKVLTSSNSLLCAALAAAARELQMPACRVLAEGAMNYLIKNLTGDGRLRSSRREGASTHPATSDDYAFLVYALLELYETTRRDIWLEQAKTWAKAALTLFLDPEDGLMYLSGRDVTDVPVRQKSLQDGALPSGNGVMAGNLIRLGRMPGGQGFREAGDRMEAVLMRLARRMPRAFTGFLWMRQMVQETVPEETTPVDKGKGSERIQDYPSQLSRNIITTKPTMRA